VIAVGLSNGANIAANLVLTYGPVVRAAVLFRAMPTRDVGSDFSRTVDPTATKASGVDVYMSSGRRDRMISPDLAERLADQLRATGASVTLEWDDAGHELTRQALAGAAEWLKTRSVARRLNDS
jgi:predicted esterase